MLYIANCGTSLAFGKTSTNNLIQLNNIHNCENEQERCRILAAKGAFYRVKIALDDTHNFIEGPLRVNNYKITNTRTLGYPLSKDRKIIISKPEIKYIKTNNLKWICLTSSGLLSVISDIEIYHIIEKETPEKITNYHKLADKCVKRVL
jgi:serine/threonine protein phosphatase PrpC